MGARGLAHPQNVFHEVCAETTDALGSDGERALIEVADLYHAALANETGVAVPGVVCAAKYQ